MIDFNTGNEHGLCFVVPTPAAEDRLAVRDYFIASGFKVQPFNDNHKASSALGVWYDGTALPLAELVAGLNIPRVSAELLKQVVVTVNHDGKLVLEVK